MGNWGLSFVAFFLVLGGASAHGSADRAAQTCEDPWTAVCLDPANRNAGLESRTAAIRTRIRNESLALAALPSAQGGCGAKPSAEMVQMFRDQGYSAEESVRLATLDAIHDVGKTLKILCLGKIVEKKVFQAIAPILTRPAIEKVFEEVRSELIAAIREKMESDPARAAVAQEMVALVKSHQLIFSDRYEEYGRLQSPKDANGNRQLHMEWIANSDGGVCGPDFLTRNLFSASTGYFEAKTKQAVHTGMLAVVTCPGQWLEVLNVPSGRPEETLWQVFGHELSHQVHATRNRVADKVVLEDGTPMTFNAVPNYAAYISCVDQVYASVLPEVSSLTKQSSYAQVLAAELGRTPTSVDFRLNEISADDWGHTVFARLAARKLSTPVERAQAVSNAMRRLCRLPSGKLSLEYGDTHPSGRFRIEAMLRHPELREKLGCAAPASTGAEHPELQFCGF